jgi:hypothetical protein
MRLACRLILLDRFPAGYSQRTWSTRIRSRSQPHPCVERLPGPGRASTIESQLASRKLEDAIGNAIERALVVNQQYHTVTTNPGLARNDDIQAQAVLLPNVNHLSQCIRTDGNGTLSGVFVADDGVQVCCFV